MRLLPWLGVVVALVAGVPASSAAGKRPVPVTVAFWDATHGLAALTGFGSCGPRSDGVRVALERTADGGRNWTRVHSACAWVNAYGGDVTLATAGTRTAALAVPGGLLRTANRGDSWSVLRAPRIEALSFASSSLGWAVVGGPTRLTLEETRSGGRTWHVLETPCRADIAKVSLVDAGHAWFLCLGGAGAGNQGKAVYETRDGGSSWTLRARTAFGTSAAGKLDSYGYPVDVVFRASGRGWMPQLRGATLTSRDSGRTWTPLPITEPEVKLGLSVSFVSDTTGFLLLQNGERRRFELDRTADGGRTWHVVHAWPT